MHIELEFPSGARILPINWMVLCDITSNLKDTFPMLAPSRQFKFCTVLEGTETIPRHVQRMTGKNGATTFFKRVAVTQCAEIVNCGNYLMTFAEEA